MFARQIVIPLLTTGVMAGTVHLSTPAMTYTANRMTAVMVVDRVEPSLAFWEKTLGFTRIAEVPHEGALGFAMLQKDGVEVMLQSEASVRADLGAHAGAKVSGTSTALFFEVSDLAEIEKALGEYPIALPRRTTFYGMHEIGVMEPGGHFVLFAQKR
jgi:uncharacterized glyoxalase superfamily protein PhnB